VVSLDSPEAVSFMRDGGNLTPAEKKKRLEDMLAASDEYVEKMFPTNQEAMRRAEQNLQRNIDISLDPDTFKFPEDPATWNELFPRSVTDSSSAQQIDRYMESKGLTFDNLTKDSIQKNLDGSAQINVINTVGVENRDKFLTALGYDVNSLNNLSNDTYRKISDSKLYLRPGGTPSTGWNGKMYDILDDSIEYEKSKIVPLDTYLKAKAEPDWYGVERPDVAPPGSRYVMEKDYGFQSNDKAVVEFTGPQNETFKKTSEDAEYNIRRVGSYGSLGFSWDLTHFEKGLGGGLEAGSNFARAQVIDSMTAVLNHMYNSRDSLAFAYADDAMHSNSKIDMTSEYDPLYHLLKYDDGKRALEIASSSNAGQLYYPLSSFGGTNPEQSKLYNDREQDRRIANFKKAYDRIKSMSTDFASYDNDAWYVERQNTTVGSPTKAHPYANVNITDPTDPTDPTPPEERDAYNYYPDFNDIEDIPARITGEDVKMTIDDLGAAGYSAYKAGGGDAKVKQGFTVAQVIKIGQANINAFAPGAPVQKPISNPESQAPNLVNNMKVILTDFLPPASKYKTNIAVSILQNKPVQNVASSRDRQLFLQGLNPNGFGTGDYSTFKVTRNPIPYADDNIRERPDGSVEVNPDPSTNNTTVVGQATRATLGFDNPLAAAGQAQVQLVIPSNNPRDAYIRYVDHAYLNLNSKDAGEIPKGDFLSGPIANLLGGGQRQHTGGFKGYPPNIKGDQVTRFDVRYEQLPDNLKQVVTREIDYMSIGGGSLGDTLQDTDATDAATVAADNKRKKKGNTVTEMYEPKAKHNEKITKHPKMKSPKEFFKRADIKPVYPDTPPPEMINGRHPDWQDDTKLAKRFSKLDPQSARAMPDTGSPQVDALIRAARKKPK